MTTEIPYDEGMRAQPGMGWPPDPDPVGSAPRPVPGLDQIPGVEQIGEIPGVGDPAHQVHGNGHHPPTGPGSTADPAGAGMAGVDGDDLATLLPRTAELTLSDGTRVLVKKLKSRELLALLGIGLTGVGTRLFELKLDPAEAPGTFLAKFAGLIISALPAAPDEAFAFLRMCVEPVGMVTEGQIDKAVKARNKARKEHLDRLLDNPEPDDLITIVEAVSNYNAADLATWGKRLAGIWNLGKRTGQIPAFLQSQD